MCVCVECVVCCLVTCRKWLTHETSVVVGFGFPLAVVIGSYSQSFFPLIKKEIEEIKSSQHHPWNF